jgi:hypothetical protein
MASYFLTGQKSKSGGGGGGGGGVGFASTVQVIASDGSAEILPVNTHGGYLDASMVRYDHDDSLCLMDAVSNLDNVYADPASTNIATEPLPTESSAMASWNLDDNSDGYNSIPSEGSWSWNGSTSGGGDFSQLHTVHDTQQHGGDESSDHGNAAQLGAAPKMSAKTAGGAWTVSRAKAAVNRATTGKNHAAGAGAATTVTTTSTAASAATTTLGADIASGGEPNTLYNRIKSAFRDNQTEDQTSHGSSNSARMTTSTTPNAQTPATSALYAQTAVTSATSTLSQCRANTTATAVPPPQTLPNATSLSSPPSLPTAARPPPAPAVPSACVLSRYTTCAPPSLVWFLILFSCYESHTTQ